ncbi:nucleotide exchange factor GrpE [Halalkalicoccus tibetensis]|uniref:Protein GrpE n=1 Tax=Halalkalicoccus tibetensis TaxID=175632 RepID=A0ABD5V3M8_9EURY
MSNEEPAAPEEDREHEEPSAAETAEAAREDAENGAAGERGRAEELEADLEEREERVEELESKLKRTQADFQNYKKRAKKRQKQVEERATEDLVERLLDVRDNLNRAVEEESEDVESLQEGVEMTLSEFDRVLEEEGVSEVAPEPGAEVDPQRHEVMMRVESDRPKGSVDEVYTSGYEMGEKVLRPAQVTVSDGNEE